MTRAVHSGESPDPTTGASAPNIVMSSTFVIDEPVSFSAQDKPEDAPYVYSRWDNPTVTVLQDKLAALEEAEADPEIEEIPIDVNLPVLPVWLATHQALRHSPRIALVWDALAEGMAPHLV